MNVMAEMPLKTTILVRDIMSSPIITVSKDTSAFEVAKILKDNQIGSVIVTNENNEYVGIITKGDLVNKVLAENLDPKSVTAEKIMSYPIKYVDADDTVQKALKVFRAHKVGKLGVMYKGKIVGILSLNDVIRVIPEILDILSEKVMIRTGVFRLSEPSKPVIGYCDHCGNWSDELRIVNGKFYCPDCIVDLFSTTD